MGANIYTNGDHLVMTGDIKNAAGAVVAGVAGTLATGSISAAAMKTLRATPVELVAAPGAGKVIELLGGFLFYDYAAAFTESADNLGVKYDSGSGAQASTDIETTGYLDATADKIIKVLPIKDVLALSNKALVLHNLGDGEFGGTGSPVRFSILYAVHVTGF